MLRMVKITPKNVWQITRLHVSKEQDDFVATNAQSLIEAYLSLTCGNGHAMPFGLYDGKEPVGFLMIGFDTDDTYEDPPRIAKGNYSLWRLMIDEKHQRKGYGRQAMELALAFIRTLPCGPAEYCCLSYEPENTAAKKLYAEFGFRENGETDGDEIVAVLKL